MKKKINVIIPSTVLGGGLRIIFTYCNYFVSRGYDVCVYIPCLFAWEDISGGAVNVKTSIANTFKRRTRIPWFDHKFKVKLALKISDEYIRDADVVIATAWFTARNVYNLSLSKGRKIYFIQDYEIWHQDKITVDNTYKLDMKRICITRTLADTILEECGTKSEVVYNGIDAEEFYGGEKEIRERKTIIMLGNFADYKGGRSGLQVLEKIYEKYRTRIIIFGLHKPDGFPDYMEFYKSPKREILLSLYRQADILLFPSLQEAWGLTVLEAMANKVAVVGMKTGCLEEIGVDYENALLADKDYEELYNRLEMLINNDELIRKLQEQGYKTARKFMWENSFKKMECLINE